jgi:hypothetical protein
MPVGVYDLCSNEEFVINEDKVDDLKKSHSIFIKLTFDGKSNSDEDDCELSSPE